MRNTMNLQFAVKLTRGTLITTTANEELFVLSPDGQIQLSLLPGERKRLRNEMYGSILTVPVGLTLNGLCGAGPVLCGNATYGAWGLFACRVVSPMRLIQQHAAQLVQGTAPDKAISSRFHYAMDEALRCFENAALLRTTFDQKLNTLLEKEAIRQGVSLTYFKTEYLGAVKGEY